MGPAARCGTQLSSGTVVGIQQKSRPTTVATGYPEPATAALTEPAPPAVSRRRIWVRILLDFCLTLHWDWVRTTFAEQDHSHEPGEAANEPVTQPLTQ